jgi:hypothetical protein
MRTMMLAAMAALMPAMAHASDVTMTIGQLAGWNFDAPGTQTGRIYLPRGRDFAFETFGNDGDTGTMTLLDASGRVLVSGGIPQLEGVGSGSFRTAYDGWYFVTVRLDASGSGFPETDSALIDKDCAASRATLCTLPVGVTRDNRLFNYGGDIDWFRTSLRGGRCYDIRIDEENRDRYGGALQVRDRHGKILASVPVGGETVSKSAAILGFRAPANGAYFVEAVWRDEAQSRYVLTLTVR